MGTGLDDCRVDGAHVVQFYESDDQLMETVLAYLSTSLQAGEAVVLIATRMHRDAFTAALASAGVDVGEGTADGRLVLLDAAETLSRFSIDGSLDAVAFDTV